MRTSSTSAALGLMLTAAALTAAPCDQGLFVTPLRYAASPAINGIGVGDFTGDGIPDVVLSDYGIGIYVMPGRADGSLSPPLAATAGHPTGVAVGDFKEDGKLDVVSTSDDISFFAGHGDGTFEAPIDLGVTMYGAVPAYVDGDAHLDLIGSGIGSTVVVLLGHGDGTFGPPIVTSVPWPPSGLAVGDLTGDGHLDVVVTSNGWGPPGVAILPGNGDGTFGDPESVGSLTYASTVAVADLDENGLPDLIVGEAQLQDQMEVYLNQGGGVFSDPTTWPVTASRFLPVDLNHDGHVDVVASYLPGFGQSNGMSVLLGNGDGTFAPPIGYVSSASAPVAIDLSAEGTPDLVAATTTGGSVSFFRNSGSGAFSAPRFSNVSPYNFSLSIASGDFDEDGLLDVAVGSYGDSQQPGLHLLRGQVGGGFVPYLDTVSHRVVAVQAAQFTSGPHLDLLVQGDFDDVELLLGNGDGTFGDPIPVISGNVGGRALIADVDGDGNLDVIVFWNPYNSPGLLTLFGDGTGQFPRTQLQPLPTQPYFASMTGGLFDADGIFDLALSMTDDTVSILLGNGDGTFRAGASYPSPVLGRMTTGVLDPSGHASIVAASLESATLAVLVGHGDGTFDPHLLGVGWKVAGLSVADFDGDGFGDLLTANVESDSVAFLGGKGEGLFRAPVSAVVGTHPFDVLPSAAPDGFVDAIVGVDAGVVFLTNTRREVTVAAASSVIVGSAAIFEATATSVGTPAFQWRRDGVPLLDGGAVSGSQTATLTIDPISFADAGSYQAVVTDSCGQIKSNAVMVAVEFADVPPSSPFHGDIITIATEGVTGGCSATTYCPTSPVRRDQMAVFLLKSEHGSGYTPPACGGVFADVPCPSAFADWVEQLAAEGVTGGCGGGNYCPDQSVTRAQMAVFLLKTSQGSSYTPPGATGIFGDVPVGSFAADFIEDLYNRGITGGCQASPLLYCPGNTVLRQQMATFLVRTFF